VARLLSSAADVIADAFDRIGEGVLAVVDQMSDDDLARRVWPGANTVGWLVWHLLRVQDDHVADAAGTEQVWTSGGWSTSAGTRRSPSASGWSASSRTTSSISGRPSTSRACHEPFEQPGAAMSETTDQTPDDQQTQDEPQQPADAQLDPSLLDPADFGPETVDGQRPAGTEEKTPSGDADPGDPDLETGPNEEVSS
jgi:hypothetical protein